MKKAFTFLSLLSSLCSPVLGQLDTASIVSSFMYVNSDTLSNYDIVAFTLKTPENAPMDWQSDKIRPLLQDPDSGFLIKVDLPLEISENTDELECTGIAKKSYGVFSWLYGKKELEIPYGGIELSVIKLEIKSNPQGADVYLVPIRVWDKRFKNIELEKSLSDMEPYKVNTSVTDTFVRIDQTVFKIVFHVNDVFKTITHRPQPQSIEPVQSVSVQF